MRQNLSVSELVNGVPVMCDGGDPATSPGPARRSPCCAPGASGVARHPLLAALADGLGLIPPGLVVVETTGDDPCAGDPRESLLPGERARVARAIGPRVAEYVTGRRCAHDALGMLGARGPVTSDRDGAPVWPAGTTGSITHCPGYRAACVGLSGSWWGIGVDAEPDNALPPAARSALIGPRDRLDATVGNAARVALCAKEAAAKAAHAAGASLVDFRHIVVALSTPGPGRRGQFRAEHPAMAGEIAGGWLVASGLVGALVALPRLSRGGR